MNKQFAYSSWFTESFPVFFKPIDVDLIMEDNSFIFKSRRDMEEWESLSTEKKKEQINKFAFPLREEKCDRGRLNLFLSIFGGLVLMLVNFFIVYRFDYLNVFSFYEKIGLYLVTFGNLFLFYFSIYFEESKKKTDVVISLISIAIFVPIIIYSIVFLKFVVFISVALFIINVILFLEVIHPVLRLFMSDNTKCYVFKAYKEFLILKGSI